MSWCICEREEWCSCMQIELLGFSFVGDGPQEPTQGVDGVKDQGRAPVCAFTRGRR